MDSRTASYSGAAASGVNQTVAGGGVTAKVTFLNPKDGDDFRVQVVLETHSVNLDAYDLKTITVLRDDSGKNYVPLRQKTKAADIIGKQLSLSPRYRRKRSGSK